MEYLFVFDLPEEFESFRRRAHTALSHEFNISATLGKTPAHVTIKRWFTTDAHPDTLQRFLNRACARIFPAPLEAKVGSVGVFEDHILYLPLIGEQLKSATERIIDLFEGAQVTRREFEGNTPHTTLVKQVPLEHLTLAVGIIGSLPPPPSSVRLSELVLYRRDDKGAPRQEVQRIYL